MRHRLAQRGVQVGVTSLSYWQRGLRRPERPESLRAVAALEEILELPAHSLRRLLPPRPSPAARDRPQSRPYRSLLEQAPALTGILDELGSPADGGLHTVLHVERVRIGAGRELLARDSQQMVRAHRDGVDRYLAIHHGDPGCAVDGVTLRAYGGCRVGRVRRHAAAGVVVAELLFDARLRSGETALLDYGFTDGSGPPSTEYVRGFVFGGGQYVLGVSFDPAALPVRCERFEQATHSTARRAVGEAPLGPGGAAHFFQEAVRPGLLGLAWEWA
ncbi:hypothetical protein [Actinacidiphila alni]|uniref:hypothetical protein n=1 Tax=Actinacidiphila alni TaxID=380248 RepID=UPI000AB20A85